MFLLCLMHRACVYLLVLLWSVEQSFSFTPPVKSDDTGAAVMSSWIHKRVEGTAPSSDLAAALQQSSWIWTTESDPPDAPAGTVGFQKTFTSPSGKVPVHANIIMTADDLFLLFVDGSFVGQQNNTHTAQFFTLPLNSSASHIFAVQATNLAGTLGRPTGPGPAGLLVAIQIQFSDSSSSFFTTDSSWVYTESLVAGWNTLAGGTSGWSAAQVISRYGGGPWGQISIPTPVASDLTFDASLWIWSTESSPPIAPPGQRAFRKTFTAPPGMILQSASAILAVDNGFTFYVGGKLIGGTPDETDTWNWRYGQGFTAPLSGTSAVFAVNATNLPDSGANPNNPAGVLATICITFTDGSSQTIVSDTTWKVFGTVPAGFQDPSFNDSSWSAAHFQHAFGEQGPPFQDVIVVNPVGGQPSTPSIIAGSSSISSPTTFSSTEIMTSLPSPQKASHINPAILAGTTVSVLVLLICIVVSVYIVWRRRKRAYNNGCLEVQNPYAPNHTFHSLNRPQILSQNTKGGPYYDAQSYFFTSGIAEAHASHSGSRGPTHTSSSEQETISDLSRPPFVPHNKKFSPPAYSDHVGV
ncbi:hypothetical protein D9619_003811 [Psilocybe cf. subviscida]|uniref:Transmembrane protein n=1 Tax=Psilocybe cf. subviscida TaxID=2480587 RepID=A0A8H5AYA2_9AGAR|nr:hypothetical protein D9619_003811 [Psilocybe cf. subviscida]